MRYQPLILLALLLAIGGGTVWARLPAQPSGTAHEPLAQAQTSLPPTPTATPTPLPPMPTPAVTIQVEDDWPRYTSPDWGISFRYPPGWTVRGVNDNPATSSSAISTTRRINQVGVPLVVSSPVENAGAIYIILQQHTLTEGGSLAEWITLHNEWASQNSMWGYSPFSLYAIPQDALPPGIDQAIFSTTGERVVPRRALWLARNGLVYSFASGYPTDQDMARMLAIIATLEFDPAVEAALRQSSSFLGDENSIRQQLLASQPEPTPECDISCQDERRLIETYVAPAATAKALPPLERPTPVTYSPLTVGDDWVTYTQPNMGITFRHPPGMSVVDPFRDRPVPVDDTAIWQWGIALTPTEVDRDRIFTMLIMPYLRGKDTPLANWEAMYDQMGRAGRRDDNFNFPYRAITYIDPHYFPHQADDVIMVNGTVYISVDHVIYQISPAAATLPLAAAIISTLEFDEARLAQLKTPGNFLGDEQQIVANMVQNWATPTPYMTPTPTPTVRATVTPAAFDSPLVNGLRRYQGEATYPGLPPFELWFDPATWALTTNERDVNYLVHHTLEGCEINLQYAAFEAPTLAPVTLAGRAWITTFVPSDQADGIGYHTGWGNGGYMFTLILDERLPDLYDPAQKGQCQRDAERVFDTFKALGVEPAATPDAAAQLPTVTPTPAP